MAAPPDPSAKEATAVDVARPISAFSEKTRSESASRNSPPALQRAEPDRLCRTPRNADVRVRGEAEAREETAVGRSSPKSQPQDARERVRDAAPRKKPRLHVRNRRVGRNRQLLAQVRLGEAEPILGVGLRSGIAQRQMRVRRNSREPSRPVQGRTILHNARWDRKRLTRATLREQMFNSLTMWAERESQFAPKQAACSDGRGRNQCPETVK
jgi:hypothetical protein